MLNDKSIVLRGRGLNYTEVDFSTTRAKKMSSRVKRSDSVAKCQRRRRVEGIKWHSGFDDDIVTRLIAILAFSWRSDLTRPVCDIVFSVA